MILLLYAWVVDAETSIDRYPDQLEGPKKLADLVQVLKNR
jgi:hypothetical protein